MAIGKAELDLIKELEEEVKKGFRKNAGKMKNLIDLKAKVVKLEAELDKNSIVDKILDAKKYAHLEIVKDDEWLHELKTIVADEYRKVQKRAKQVAKFGVVNTNRFDSPAKKSWLTKFVTEFPNEEITTADLKKALAKIGVSQNPKTWLDPLKLGKSCWSDVQKGNKRLGQYFHWDKVTFLKDAVAEAE